jgi:hypothetical protein
MLALAYYVYGARSVYMLVFELLKSYKCGGIG